MSPSAGSEDVPTANLLSDLIESGGADRLLRRVYRPCRRFIAYDDFRQDVLVRVIEHSRGFRGHTPAMLAAWIKAIASQMVVDHLRRSKRHGLSPLPPELGDREPSSRPETFDESEWLRRAVDTFSSKDREIFDRHYRKKQRWSDIAKEMGIKHNTIVQRHLRMIRRLMDLRPPEGDP